MAQKKKVSGRQKALKILELIVKKKVKNPVIMDMRKISNFCDYFIICSGDSGRQVRAIYEEALRRSKENKLHVHHAQDDASSQWFLLDYFDVMLHIFDEAARSFYDIERVWREARRLPLPKRLTDQLHG